MGYERDYSGLGTCVLITLSHFVPLDVQFGELLLYAKWYCMTVGIELDSCALP